MVWNPGKKCGLEPGKEIWAGDAMGHQHLGYTLMETREVDEAGQEMVLNKRSPRKHLRNI